MPPVPLPTNVPGCMPVCLQDTMELSRQQRLAIVTAWHRYLSCVDDARKRSRLAVGVLRGQAGPVSRQEDQFLPGNADACLEHSGAEGSEVGARPSGWQACRGCVRACVLVFGNLMTLWPCAWWYEFHPKPLHVQHGYTRLALQAYLTAIDAAAILAELPGHEGSAFLELCLSLCSVGG